MTDVEDNAVVDDGALDSIEDEGEVLLLAAVCAVVVRNVGFTDISLVASTLMVVLLVMLLVV